MQHALTYAHPVVTDKAQRPADPDSGMQRRLWKLLDALALCRRDYGLTANSLSVLRALISFLPRTASAADALIVWPSNRSLSERADGMDERTLRRHLDRLVKAGLIARRSSSNGKRFALRSRGAVIAAFGFDLGSLHNRADEIATAAEQERTRAEHGAAMRVEVLNLLHLVATGASPLDPDEDAEIRRLLRRRIDLQQLADLRDKLLEQHDASTFAPNQLPASDGQNDRHQQKTNEESYESVSPRTSVMTNSNEPPKSVKASHCQDDDVTLAECLDATTESRAFASEPVRNWPDLIRLADTLTPMIGISHELAEHCRRSMGALKAAIAVLCIVQRSSEIHRPAAYLRRLAILAESGKFSLRILIRSALRVRFAAANHATA